MRDVPDILAKIAAYKVDEVAQIDRDAVEENLANAPQPKCFLQALSIAAPPALICEVKKASPSKGVIRGDFDPAAIARAYEAGGAACLSVLTDGPSFGGDPDFLRRARGACGLPALRKDFLVDPYQVIEARAWHGDAVLIIMACTADDLARDLLAAAGEHDLDVLIEVHDEAELERAVALPSEGALLGVNNRDLRTFETDLGVTERLSARTDRPLVAESGIGSHADVRRLGAFGVRRFLVGESLMRQADVTAATRALLGG